MKWISKITSPKKLDFAIEKVSLTDSGGQKTVGFYLYVYENGRCTHDYLQDTLEAAKLQAFEHFNQPINSWIRAVD